MTLFELTRQLIDIPSVTGDEAAAACFLSKVLNDLGYRIELQEVETNRFNVIATTTAPPAIVFSTHIDTVPPFIPSSEDSEYIYGRGSCDAKGIIAAQISAAEQLRASGIRVGLLFVSGEERDSAGAKLANLSPKGSRFLINGEPTDNRLAIASKGTLRATIRATGKMAHSAYPELGDNAIHKLIAALKNILQLELPTVEGIGP